MHFLHFLAVEFCSKKMFSRSKHKKYVLSLLLWFFVHLCHVPNLRRTWLVDTCQMTYYLLLKQYKAVTIANRRAAKQTAMRSALLYGGFGHILFSHTSFIRKIPAFCSGLKNKMGWARQSFSLTVYWPNASIKTITIGSYKLS